MFLNNLDVTKCKNIALRFTWRLVNQYLPSRRHFGRHPFVGTSAGDTEWSTAAVILCGATCQWVCRLAPFVTRCADIHHRLVHWCS